MKADRVKKSIVAAVTLLMLGYAWKSGAKVDDTSVHYSPVLGQPIDGLSSDESSRFEAGLLAFSKVETPEDGVGPVFNGTSCGECHKAGAVGGAGTDHTTSVVTRIGGLRNKNYSDLEDLGGPVLQSRSIREFNDYCPIKPEVVPAGAQYVSHRITTPLFGAGLIEAIPEETILARAGIKDADGVKGIANRVFNHDTGLVEVGRFGWKAQHSSLRVFAADAYLNEMGISSALFPSDNKPQGQPIPPEWKTKPDPEDGDGDVEFFVDFMRMLAPPGRRLPISSQALLGEKIFTSLRCNSCHVPSMTTGNSNIQALAYRKVPLYSDLLLHQMGPKLADEIRQGLAKGDMFKTAPLWGISRRNFFLHDGRASTVEEAIVLHGGEALPHRNRYLSLPNSDRMALTSFLLSL